MHYLTASQLSQHSLDLITGLQTASGAYPASPSFSAYAGYCWFRDGAFIADAASSAGRPDSAERFFDWCATVLTTRSDQIRWIVAETRKSRPPSGEKMLPARYTFDGANGNDDWWDFQTDGYGTWLWALAAHLKRVSSDAERWRPAAQLTVDYLAASWERACYDWWEEHAEHVHVSTLASIAAGLGGVAEIGILDVEHQWRAERTASEIRNLIRRRGIHDGALSKWIGSTAVDASLAAVLAPLAVIEPASDLGLRTIDKVERHLTVDDGTHRYLGDTFYGGGQWPLLSCFLGLAHLVSGNRTRAEQLHEWAASTATNSQSLPEQVGRHLIAPAMREEWIERWGPVATPLLWSHAMFLRLGVELDVAKSARPAPDVSAPIPEVTAR